MNLDFQTLSAQLLNAKNNQLALTRKDGTKVVVTKVDLVTNTVTYREVKKGRPKMLSTNDLSIFQQ